jgi:hypothetical protein
MATVVSEMQPDLAHLSIKGAFRFAIQESLKEQGVAQWRDLAGQPVAARKRFFEKLCDRAIPRVVKLGFPQDKTKELDARLQKLNERYLQG